MIRSVAKNVLRPILTPFSPGNIIMFHIGRCGSTVLSSMLDQHSKVFWASEFYVRYFREWERANDGRELSGELPGDAIQLLKGNMRHALHRYYGFELKPFHLRLIGYPLELYMDNLENLGFTHYILLDRENRLRKMISSIIAHEDRIRYHQKSSIRSKLRKTHIDVDYIAIDYDHKSLLKYLTDYDEQVRALKSKLGGKNYLSLTYEADIQNDPRIAYVKVCDYLNLTPKRVEIPLSRTNPFPVRDMIENYDEVEAVLTGTKYEWMLKD